MRPGRAADLEAIRELTRRSVAGGEADVVPSGAWLERLLTAFDWESRSRVVERAGKVEAAVVVFERPAAGGVVTRVEAHGDPALRPDLIEWGVRYSRACGAAVAQVWRGRGRGADVAALGLSMARPFLRMDRPALGEMDSIPAPSLPAGYRLLDDGSGLDDHTWAEAYNASFADHWRFSPKTDAVVAGRRAMPGGGPELMAVSEGGEPAALVTCSVERYDDRRAQPVGIVATVGTVPEHRRRGLARVLLVEALRRLRRAGASSASLYVDGLNPTRAFELYAWAGFDVAFEFEVWEADFT